MPKIYQQGIWHCRISKQIRKGILPDRFKNTLEKKQHNAINKLEEIQFCYLPENQYKLARQVAEYLWQETKFHMGKE